MSSFDLLTANDAQLLVLDTMCDELGYSFEYIAAETGVPENACRSIIRKFRELGIANYGVLYDEDELRVRGSGYWLNGQGYRAKKLMGDLVGWQGLWAMRDASCDRNPKGEKPQALSAEHESAIVSEASETPIPDHSSETPVE